jgi:hypothetical protein
MRLFIGAECSRERGDEIFSQRRVRENMFTMKLKRVPVILLIMACCVLSCSDEAYDPIEFKIVCVGGDFEGYYIVDGGSLKAIENPIGVGSNTFQFEKEIDELDYLEISATIESNKNASITIKIYRDDEKVKEATLSVDEDDDNRTLELDYDYGEENEGSEETTVK